MRTDRDKALLLSRRHLLGPIATGALLHSTMQRSAAKVASPRLKVIVTGGHPGDPECGCGGTIARYVALGHSVTLLYLNHGEGYCGSATLDRCAAIRTAEAEKACQVLGTRAAFAGQYDGRATVDNIHYDEFRQRLAAEHPDIVFTHWALDQHRDHRAISTLTLDAWLRSGKHFALYYYEVADDTVMFTPGEYVDISGVVSRKREACYAHLSQSPEKWYPKQQEITRFRGMESGHSQAEAFIQHWQGRRGLLP